jgi:hypothetical protein
MAMRWPIVALSAALLLAGCLVPNDPTPSVLDCGVEDQQMGTNLNAEGRLCLLDAFEQGRPARFESRLTTIEGDPIVRRYLIVSASEVQIEHDASRDRFGSGTIDVLRCPRIVPVAEWNRVMNDEMRDEEVFVEDSCQVISSRQPG